MEEAIKKILLVEDDESFRDILKSILTKAGYETTVAADGQVAQYVLSVQPHDLVISDIRMPQMDGLELLKWTKEETDIPVILMTGFAEILETKEAYELGANEFLPKPFKQQDLLSAIDFCKFEKDQEKAQAEEEEEEEERYCKIALDDFTTGREIPFTIFVKLSDNKFVKIAYKGEDLSLSRIHEYKLKGLKHLYMLLDDFQAYLQMSLKITKALTMTNSIPKEKKLNFVKHAGEIIQEKLFLADVNQEEFSNAKEFVGNALQIVTQDEDVMTILQMLENHSDFLYAHSLGVSLYSVMLAKKAEWKSIANQFRVAMAGLLHDIGKKEIDRSILDKKRILLNQVERALIETHPARGQEIISQLKSVPQDLAQIVYQHHEDCNGYGYPVKLTRKKIHPMARMLAVVDTFCNYTIPGPQSDGMSAHDAITQMTQFHVDRLDDKFFGILKQTFRFGSRKKGLLN